MICYSIFGIFTFFFFVIVEFGNNKNRFIRAIVM